MNEFDVCIIGAGTSGMAAVYALKGCRKKNGEIISVVLIDKSEKLGGTAVNGWVETWIEGLTPPYLSNLLEELGYKKEAIIKSNLPFKYSKILSFDGEGKLFIQHDRLAEKYQMDMPDNVRVCLGTEFLKVTRWTIGSNQKKVVSAILVKNSLKEFTINANYFIDCSADGELCRSVNPVEFKDYYYGEDPKSRFNESLAPEHEDVHVLNEPSLFYEIAQGVNDEKILSSISDVVYDKSKNKVYKPDYIVSDGYFACSWVNPMSGLGITGSDIIKLGYTKCFSMALKRMYEHWKFIKLELIRRSEHHEAGRWGGYDIDNHRSYGITSNHAPMLGVRESYRIVCDYMLNQNDLEKQISSNDLGDSIACGSHIIDFHVYGSIDPKVVKYFNDMKLRPSGIPYRCLIPLKCLNVLIACRAYGASHIALAARRVNKDMAQLGWAAGNAIKWCLEQQHEIVNVRSVNISDLQSENYTGFKSNVQYIESEILI